jgi:hypothetical protein
MGVKPSTALGKLTDPRAALVHANAAAGNAPGSFCPAMTLRTPLARFGTSLECAPGAGQRPGSQNESNGAAGAC